MKTVWKAAACAMVLAFAGTAQAQQYPNRSIRMIIPAAPGGGVDTVGRAVGQKMSEALGQAIVADNRAGAGTMIASELTAKSPPDGYTFLVASNSHAINAGIQKNLKYDPLKDFIEVSLLSISPFVVVVHPSVPVKTLRDLIDLARKRPGQLHFASAGSGSATHLAGELFKSLTKTNMLHVPYKGGSPAVTDLLGGHVQVMFNNLISVQALAKAGRLRALAVTSTKRLGIWADLPTVIESGVPGYESGSWYGILLPARTPQNIVNILSREAVKAVRLPDVRERLANDGAEVVGSTPEEFTAYMRKDIERWTKLAAALDIKPE
jgi:tripartite-type tricarboxylate transporter receptor subunit TctC